MLGGCWAGSGGGFNESCKCARVEGPSSGLFCTSATLHPQCGLTQSHERVTSWEPSPWA